MPTTILVDVQLQKADAKEHDASLQELRQLVETLGAEKAAAAKAKLMVVDVRAQSKNEVV